MKRDWTMIYQKQRIKQVNRATIEREKTART